MELTQLECFVAVAEERHFGRAARRLMIGQPAVSQRVARLERELGSVLFERTSRSVALTTGGERFLPAAREVLAAVERAHKSVDADRTAVLRLGSSSGLGQRLARVLEALRQSDPPVEARLVYAPTQARLDQVRAGQLDATFVRGIAASAGLEHLPVWRDRLVVALSAHRPEASQEPLPLAALAALPLRVVPRSVNQPLVDLLMSSCAAAGIDPILESGTQRLDDTLAELSAGRPVWTVLYAAHADQLRTPGVAFRDTEPRLEQPTYLALRGDRATAGLAPLLRACAAADQAGEDRRRGLG
ncbi:MAG TPA: LysR family transcriptional regulator [Pseudonocardia sp.]